MKINCGIIGLPNVGKSTIFQLLTNISVKTDNFPFCTIHPNIATIKIPDTRLYQLYDIIKARSIIHETIEFVDTAGLIKGASKGIGLGNKILNYIQTTKILCHVIRCFDNNTIYHVDDNIDPKKDINTINTELILFDILQCEKNISILQKNNKIDNYTLKLSILKKCLTYLYNGIILQKVHFSKIETKYIQQFNFLTFKPIIYIANVNKNYLNNVHLNILQKLGTHENIPVIPICAIDNFKLITQGYILQSIIKNILSLLQLNTFFTVNTNMIRAWIYLSNATTIDVSNYIHSDFKKKFIRAQIIKFPDFIQYRGEFGAKKSGKIFYVGKNHLIEDGDILKILFQK